MENNKVYTWWYSNKIIEGIHFENFGDILSKYLVEKITGKEVEYLDPRVQKWYDFRKINIVTGSVISFATRKCNVWGAGIMKQNEQIRNSKIFAVRGPETVKRLNELGYKVNPPIGDPALLLPKYYNPQVKKKYKIGIIPHYVDVVDYLNRFKNSEDIKVVDLRKGIEEVIADTLICERTISSSLHGLIVSHAYNIPSIRVLPVNKIAGDGIKFDDYFGSVNIKSYNPFLFGNIEDKMFENNFWEKHKGSALINEDLEMISRNLLSVCPFV